MILFAVFLIPQNAFARPLWYGRIVGATTSTAYIEWRDLENKYYFSCDIKTFSCKKITNVPDLSAVTKKATGPVAHLPNIYDKTAGHQTLSNSKRFGSYVRFDEKTKVRKIVFVDGKNQKRYYDEEPVDFWNLLDDQPRVFRYSADDTREAYVSDRSGYMSLYVVSLPVTSNKAVSGTQITEKVTVGDFIFYDKSTIVYVANRIEDPYNWVLYSYDLNTKAKKVLAEHIAYTSYLRKSGDALLFNQLGEFGTVPMELVSLKSTVVRGFDIPQPNLDAGPKILYIYQNISGMDAVLMKKEGDTNSKSPLIIWLHGGPYRQASFIRQPYISYGSYDTILEDAVLAGATVLKIDYAGSYGNGRSFTEKIKKSVGITDVSDVVSALRDYTKSNQYSKAYLVGNSYGGYLSLKTLEEYPDLFSGALSVNGVTDWASLNDYLKTSIFNSYFEGTPTEKNKDLYDTASIVDSLDTAKLKNKKIYIVHAEKDTSVAFFQAGLLTSALSNKNIPYTFVPIPFENHVFAKNSSLNTICENIFAMASLNKSGRCNISMVEFNI